MFIRKKPYTGPVRAVVLDWAGTAVDYGCMGPAAVFINLFKEAGIPVETQDARQFMGLAKKDHIRAMLALPHLASAWEAEYGRSPEEADVEALYKKTAPMMIKAISGNSDPIPGAVQTLERLREMKIKVGSSTGYVREMMDVLAPLAREKGYAPDAVFCSSDVPAGRPWPWMCYLNAVALETYPLEAMVKIGDTRADIQEGLNAGMWTVGITKTGNEMGLDRTAVESMDEKALFLRLSALKSRFKNWGAHYVIEEIGQIFPVLQEINQHLARGEQPLAGGAA